MTIGVLDKDSNPVTVSTIDDLLAQGIGGHTPLVSATMTRLDEATVGAYTAGDLIANSTTAASVVPLSFSVARTAAAEVSGRLAAVRCVVAPASSNLVVTNLDFDLLLFRPAPNIPFTAGSYPADNAALVVTAAMYRQLIGVFSFVNSSWRNTLGGVTADVTGYQVALPSSGRTFMPYNLTALTGPPTTLLGLVQARGAWTPGHVNQQFDFYLDADLD